MIKVEINGDPLGIREARGGLPAAVTGYGREQVRDLAHLTDRLIDGQGGEIDSFLLGIGHTFYHAGAAPASLQTSITQSPSICLQIRLEAASTPPCRSRVRHEATQPVVKKAPAYSELFERHCQPFHSWVNSLFICARIAKDQPSTRQRFQAESGDGQDLDTDLGGQFGRLLIIFAGRQPADKLHPSLRGANLEQAAQVGVQFALEQLAKLFVMVAHMTQMAGIMALVQKVAERHLL